MNEIYTTAGSYSFDRRPEYFRNVENEWYDWRWQLQQAVRDEERLREVFPTIPQHFVEAGATWRKRKLRYTLTPYMLALCERDKDGNPLESDPIWRQFFPLPEAALKGPDEYSPAEENWEHKEEMLTPILHWKYDNRAIIYTPDSCLAYCNFCLRSLQSTAPQEEHGGRAHWKGTIEAIRNHPEIEEVILSGGDPLLYIDAVLESMLADIRSIPWVKAIRIHTRAWTHNPFRIDEEFCELLKKYSVTEMSVHVAHPNELSADFEDCVSTIRESGARTLLLSQQALIKGVNDDVAVLREHWMRLYTRGVKPYYIIHCTPNVPGARLQRTSVRKGVELMRQLKRHFSNPAVPEYIIAHHTGKKTVPESLEGAPDFIYAHRADYHPVVRFQNWKGNWCEYLDGVD